MNDHAMRLSEKACRYLHPVRLIFALLLITGAQSLEATSRDNTMEVMATTDSVSASITLNWTNKSSSSTLIYKRVKGATTWQTPITVSSGIYTYIDKSVTSGVAYEYSLNPTGVTKGGIVVGYNIPLVESRGKVILLVDQTMTTPLASELSQLQKNMVADGWTVIRHDVPREVISPTSNSNTVWSGTTTIWQKRIAEQQNIRSIVQADYTAAPGNDWSLFIFGRIPVPYSGLMNPDGHGDHYGAWPSDQYYASMNQTWTDTTVNTALSGLADVRNYNLIGDGKFDINTLSAPVELQCGRVDLSNMPSVPTGMTETELLRQYLVRDDRFRRVQAPFNAVARRGIVDDNFNAYGQTAWGSGFAFFGRDAGQMDAADWFGTLSTTPMLFAYGCGGGLFYGAAGIGESGWDFGKTDSKAVFTQLFGSYFGDWDCVDNFMRAPLAGTNNSLGLTCMWSGRGQIPLYHMALGDAVGYCTRAALNNAGSVGDWYQGGYVRCPHQNLMGDPTLRLHSIAPPVKVTATSAAGGITINWQASPDSTLSGYHVYRSTSVDGPFARISGTTADGSNPTGSCLNTSTLTFTDTSSNLAAGTSYTYLVKAVRMESSPSGTYANQSIGEFVTITHLATAPTPIAPTRLTVNRAATSTCVLTWDDNATDETAYLVERCDPTTGIWSQINSVSANTTTYTDANSPAGKAVNYRVRAANANGNSAYSNTGADYRLPGIVYEQNRYYVTNKDSGVCSTGLYRFNGNVGDVTLTYSTIGILGTAGTDYTATTSSVTWAHGTSGYKALNIVVPNPAGLQLTKIFQVTYSGTTNGLALGAQMNPYLFISDSAARALPSLWSTTTFGTVSGAGYAEHVSGTYGLTVQSNSMQSYTDSCRYLYQTVAGDFTFSARVLFYPTNAVHAYASTGISVRSDLTAGSASDTLTVGNDYGFARNTRLVNSGSSTYSWVGAFDMKLEKWLRIVRAGYTTTCYTSSDGTNWTVRGTTTTLSNIPSTAYVGLLVSSGQGSNAPMAYAQFDNVTLTTSSYPAVGNIATFSAAPGSIAGQAILNWSAATGASTYQVERSTLSNSGFVKIGTVTDPTVSYTDSGLAYNTTYYYRVMALNPLYSSSYTTVASTQAYNPYSQVGSIAGCTATAGTTAGDILVNWSAATAATSYQIERSTSSNSGFYSIDTVTAPTLTYTDSWLAANTTYYYRVKGLNPAYGSAYSPVAAAQPYLPAGISGWRYINFGDTNIYAGYSGDLDTLSDDHVTNLMKYVLGLPVFDSDWNPIYTNPTSLPVIQKQTIGLDQYLTCTLTHNKSATDTVITVEVTSDLNGTWTSLDPFAAANQVSITDNTPSSGVETIVIKDTQPISATTKRFMRFKVTH